MIDSTWAGLLGILLGAVITFVGQMLRQRKDIASSLRKERHEAYALFLTAAYRGGRAANESLHIWADLDQALAEHQQTSTEFDEALAELDQSKADDERLETDYKREKAEFKRVEAELKKAKGKPVERELINQSHGILDAMNLSLGRLKRSMERMKRSTESIKLSTDKFQSSTRKFQDFEIRRATVEARVNDFLLEMDQAIVLMQLASPPLLAEVGEELRRALDDRTNNRISQNELVRIHTKFTSLAKHDLSLARTSFRIFRR